jgi:peptidoglycan-associated lipoprotein
MKRRFTALKSATVFACAVVLALGLSACQSTTGPEELAPEPQPASEFVDEDISAETTPAPEPVPDTAVAEPARMLELDPVYFDYDDASIRTDARPTLRRSAERLRGWTELVTIEGHCDERGNEEYNLALGERRAHAVKDYLENLGVSRSQLRTVSYGEAKPAVMGHNESAWKYNRRSEFRSGR